MESMPLIIGDKVAKLPVVQGGMGVGISLHKLAGAVAKEGGVGVISAAQIGFQEPDFDTKPFEANKRAIRKEYELARKIAPDGIIGFNIMTAMRYYKEYVEAAAAAGADLIISGAGLPTDLPGYVEGYDTKIAPIVSTQKSAHVILKYWDRKYKRTADLVVIEGAKAGGHLGFHREELDNFDEEAYQEEIKKTIALVRQYEEKYGRKIPIVVGGGITTADDFKRVCALGADGIQVGTRFVTTEECDADIRYKQMYVNAKKEDIKIVQSPVGMPGRAIRNKMIRRVESGEQIPHSPCHGCMRNCNPKTIPYCITDALINAARGNVDEGLIFCGADAYRTDKIETVHDVITSFIL